MADHPTARHQRVTPQTEAQGLSFSQRHGLKPAARAMQADSMDDRLRNRLWTATSEVYWERIEPSHSPFSGLELFTSYLDTPWARDFVTKLWDEHLGLPVQDLPRLWVTARDALRHFYRQLSWNEVYDWIMALVAACPDEELNAEFAERCNRVLEAEAAPYRLVCGSVIDLTRPEQIHELEAALYAASDLRGVEAHLESAIAHYADRDQPDYRNSIKESISAVESLCCLLAGDPKASLGDALKRVDSRTRIHPSLKGAFSKLYGWTSDAHGIRHGLGFGDDPEPLPEDARWMLITCSAFVSYLIATAARAGVDLSTQST